MSAKILLADIETAPILAHVWGLWDQNVGLNQIHTDWHLLSWCAKWLGDKELMYMDQRGAKNVEDDKRILKGIWNLLDEADVVIWQNGKKFDNKKLNARFVMNDMKPPSGFKQIDTLDIAKRRFGFTSNKLEYLSSSLCTKYKKLTHKKYPGFELWKECLAGNEDAWKEMEKYNKHDVLALEELYTKLMPWDNTVNFNLYSEGEENECSCGSKNFVKNGFYYTNVGKFQRYLCNDCGSETHSTTNLLSKEKKASITKRTVR